MSEATEILLQINLVFWLIYGFGILFAILYVVLKIRGLIHNINARVTPIANQVENTVNKVTGAAQTVADQAEEIARTARGTADHVASRVDSVAEILQDTIVTPAIRFGSLVTGVRRAAETLRDRWTRRPAEEEGGASGGKD
jgi:uncharacterized protein YoxC